MDKISDAEYARLQAEYEEIMEAQVQAEWERQYAEELELIAEMEREDDYHLDDDFLLE